MVVPLSFFFSGVVVPMESRLAVIKYQIFVYFILDYLVNYKNVKRKLEISGTRS